MSDSRTEMSYLEYREMIEREQGLAVPAASAPKRQRRSRPATRMTEEELQKTITEAAMNHGYQVHHETDSRKSRGGFPDLHICGHGRQFVFELKSDRGESRPDQRVWIREYQRAGVDARFVYPEDLDAVLAELQRSAA